MSRNLLSSMLTASIVLGSMLLIGAVLGYLKWDWPEVGLSIAMWAIGGGWLASVK